MLDGKITASNGVIATKADIANPTFTGTVTAPAVLITNNSTVSNILTVNGALNVNGTLNAPQATAGTPGLSKQGAAVADSTGADVAANRLAINNLLASLRGAGIIA